MTENRQRGVGVQGGAEAIALTHRLIEQAHEAEKLRAALAIVQIEQRTMFGTIQWDFIRGTFLNQVPHFAASAGYEHHTVSHVRQKAAKSNRKNKGLHSRNVSLDGSG